MAFYYYTGGSTGTTEWMFFICYADVGFILLVTLVKDGLILNVSIKTISAKLLTFISRDNQSMLIEINI